MTAKLTRIDPSEAQIGDVIIVGEPKLPQPVTTYPFGELPPATFADWLMSPDLQEPGAATLSSSGPAASVADEL